ncbi:hypothetical protein PYCC9005_002211 [Savitreella phatthalungensis]
MTTLTVYLIRHGETDSNVRRQLQGWLDSPLNANGQSQARRTGALLGETRFDRAFVSSLTRCRQTSLPILENRPPALEITHHEDLWEKNLGDLEGMEFADAQAKMQAEGKVLDNYGEGQLAFARRLLQFWDTHVVSLLDRPPRAAEYATQGRDNSEECLPSPAASEDRGDGERRVLIVTHGGCVATLGRELTKSVDDGGRGYAHSPEYNGQTYMVPRNTSITEVVIAKDDAGKVTGKIVRFGDARHIGVSGETIVGADAQIGKPQAKAAI